MGSIDDSRALRQRVRRYSVSKNSKPANPSQQPATPPSTPINGLEESHDELILSEPSLLRLDQDVGTHTSPETEIHSPSIEQIESQKPPEESLEQSPPRTPEITQATPHEPAHDLTETNDFALQELLTTELLASIESGSQDSVLSAFREFQSRNITPSLSTYEQTLSFLASGILNNDRSENLSHILTIYMDAVTKHATKSSNIYSPVISSLVSLAEYTAKQKEQNLAYFRLNERHASIPSSVQAAMQQGDSSKSLYTTALDMFEASNSVKTQRYTAEVYQQILDACIKIGNYSLIYPVTRMLEVNNCTLNADIFISLITGYGRHGDIKAAVETFKHYKSLASNLVSRKEHEVYAALVGAYFDSNKPEEGLIFLNKVLDSNTNPTNLMPVIAEVILSYCRIGDHASALNWIQRIDKDEKMNTVDMQTMVKVLSAATDAGDITTSSDLFDFMASTRDAQIPLFNVARNDFLAACVRANDTENLFKGIKETHLRSGVWELATIMDVTKYLISVADVEFALRTFDIQSKRYLDHMAKSNLPITGQSADAINIVERELSNANSLTPSFALQLAKTDIFDASVFSDVNGGGIACMKLLWRAQADGSIKAVIAAAPHAIVDIVSVHLKWIRTSGANNSLGGLAIPSSLLNDLRSNFVEFVQLLMKASPALEESFKGEITNALTALDAQEAASEWSSYCESLKPQEYPNITPPLPLVENRFTANQIILAAQNSNTLRNAVKMLQAALTRGEFLGPDAYVALIESGASAKDSDLVRQVYRIALSSLPRPSEAPGFFEAWVPIHRAVVRTANIHFEVAKAAYNHLISLGVYPDATGYGQLISNAPVNEHHDEASDALLLFNEARANHVPMNTFLYNVVISKLSKARRLNDAIYYFNDMNLTGTKKSSVTYGTIISACCRCCDEASALKFFEEMESEPNYVPRIAPFNIILQYFVHHKRDRKSALQIYDRLRKIGLKPSAHTYKLLIDAYSMIEPIDIDAADNVLLSIIADNNAVTTKHYSSLLYARGVSLKNQIAAQEFYNALVLNNRVRPDKHIFQALLETYVVNNSVRSTPGVLKDMVSYGVDLDAYMANILIRGWAPVSLEKSRGLFNHILEAGITEPSSFESIIRAYLYYGDVAAAQGVLNLMVKHLYPQPVIAKIQALIDAHNTPATKLTEDMLLESIFRQDSQALTGQLGFKDARKDKREDNGPFLEVFDNMPNVKSEPKLVDF